MTVRPMNAKAFGHVGFFIRGIQFRTLGRVKTQKLAATELNPSRHVRGRGALMGPALIQMPLQLSFRSRDRAFELEIGHSPFHTGLRFSMNACTPSRKSR